MEMQDLLNFLTQVRYNNNREWFHQNKSWYDECQAKFNAIAEKILFEVGKFDESVRHLQLKDCIYRFYRDVRFSKDKSPYKTHFGIYICPGGKKSWEAGYYFHIEPRWEDGTGGSGLFNGCFMPDKDMLQMIREDIFNDGENYRKVIKKTKGFTLDTSNALKTRPKGMPESEYDDLLRLKSFLLNKPIDDDYLLADDLVEKVVKDMKECYPFVKMLNQAISFSGNY